MAENQAQRHELGRIGESVVSNLTGGELTTHKAPFDVVDFNSGIAYEVKSMSGLSVDLKIHISDSSMTRKRKFMKEYGLKGVLLAVVIYSDTDIRIYRSKLQQSVRVNKMKLVK